MFLSDSVYPTLLSIKSAADRPPEEIKLLTMTWNMARKVQTPELSDMLPNVQLYDLVVLTFQESKQRQQFIQRLDAFMESHNFKKLNDTHMWEMFIIAYTKK